MQIVHGLQQGSPEWHAHRAKHFNASEAAAMLGLSPHMSRDKLLREKHFGLAREHSDYVQERILDPGHEFEALARPRAELLIADDLYPVVGTDGKLSASFDGLTLLHEIGWEHKRLNEELRELFNGSPPITGRDLPIHHQVQLEQQCMISGATRVLFHATDWDADGALVAEAWCWYEPNTDLAARIRNGWAQFEEDLAIYVPVEVLEAPSAAPIKSLPALLVRVEGRVVSSNLEPFRLAATEFIAKIKTELQNDQDFADAEAAMKFCKGAEERLELVKAQALSQTVSIDQLFSTIDSISGELRGKRLGLEKQVKTRKETIRADIVKEHQDKLDAHVKTLNTRLGEQWIARFVAPFGEAIKGKKTITGLRDACATMLTNAKLDLSAHADTLALNRKALIDTDGVDWFFLFADFAVVGGKPAEDFKAIAAMRIQAHKEAEEKRKAPPPPAPAPAPAPVVSVAEAVDAVFAPAVSNRAAATETATLKLGVISDRLGFKVTEAFVVDTLGMKVRDRSGTGVLFFPSDFGLICDKLVERLNKLKTVRFE